ncbi:quinone oxidoreductase [Pseudomassariella vexata]|uniref:Quinone oxidoreductase n=1 Tax=Pseudomassariella vexata TaxID=1141098 RepID=A0A1Y2E5Z3_9PEZI|nr:quinone oxidoreductase [Pseudomassariella vexata]ORY66980.1 quinone oxidoreductase [Pseudomassariella vexata]
MKAVVVDRYVENYGELRVSEVAKPKAKDDEILIQVKAAGVNFVDTLYARGLHQNNRRHIKPPFTLGLEFAGLVLSSPTTSPFRPGDGVFGAYAGSYSEYIVLPSSYPVYRVPPSWSYAEAAGIAATLPVSYGALSLPGVLKPGSTVLVHAAAGGLGLAAVQICSALGYRVFGTAGSAAKCRLAGFFGAEACIDYEADPRWWDRVVSLTDGNGVDVVFDSVGLVEQSIKCLAHRGRALVVGFAGRNRENLEKVAMNRVLLKQASLIGYRFGETGRRYPHETTIIWEALLPLIKSGRIKPAVYDREYRDLGSVPRALEHVASRKVWGKAVILIDDDASRQRASL